MQAIQAVAGMRGGASIPLQHPCSASSTAWKILATFLPGWMDLDKACHKLIHVIKAGFGYTAILPDCYFSKLQDAPVSLDTGIHGRSYPERVELYNYRASQSRNHSKCEVTKVVLQVDHNSSDAMAVTILGNVGMIWMPSCPFQGQTADNLEE
ncbi:unnamed protein product [Urochloa humidicola]